MKECTFAPDIERSSNSLHLTVRSHNSSLMESSAEHQAPEQTSQDHLQLSLKRSPHSSPSLGGRSRKQEPAAEANMIFSPSTNAIAPHMVYAKTYARQNVFSRLSSSQPEWPTNASSEASNNGSQADTTKSQRGSGSSAAVSSTTKPRDPLQDETFYNFLQRQNEFEEERLLRLAEVEKHTAPIGRPRINPHSRKLARQCRARSQENISGLLSPSSMQQSSPTPYRPGSPTKDVELTTGISATGRWT